MGLMYVFPVAEDETDFYVNKDGTLILKSYGLPYIFWFYAVCVITVIFFMFLAIKAPILKLITLGDETDAMLGYSLLSFVGLLPVIILGFFFYEKRITRNVDEIGLEHRVYGLKVFSEKFILESSDQLIVESFLSSPNMARMKNTEDSVGFQNKGYFVLKLITKNNQIIQIDRHARKADLEKLKALLIKYQ